MIRIRQVKIPISNDNNDHLKKKISHILKTKESDIKSFTIIKKSIDARDKNNILYVYEFDVDTDLENKILSNNNSSDIFLSPKEEYVFPESGNEKLDNKIVIVGSGPSGLFCSYLLTELGYKPIIIEQGEKVEDRVKTVNKFFETNKLNELSNVQFGEGGAGTFSDGKLNTLIKDKMFRGKKVFEIFVENGAPEEIMYLQKPHIGTDILREVIINMRNKIINRGGEFLYNTKLTNLVIEDNKIIGIEINNKERIDCSVLVLAIGHSARDTFYMLNNNHLEMKSKPFAIGLRIEHPSDMINKSQYGDNYKLLPPASYKLTYQTSTGRGVYSFCMCPGGFVVNASSEKNRLVVNGMSNYKRDERNSNSAIVVTVDSKDFGNELFSGIEFQRRLEEKAYDLGKGFIPVQLYKDFKNNKVSEELGEIIPNTKGKYTLSNLNDLFNKEIVDSIKEGIDNFGRKIKGFDREDAVLLGIESRTSSPVIIKRNEEFQSNILGVYPCGEGAGYAGGITTAAIDGIKVAEEIIKKYKID
ncbi:MAG: NAD(P)/FAD-dependent oxidoreductase [Bacilli bacterium]|nr:NAD(P)/FAD-dependent oxidoreductase [Bacilli bacterium]